MDASGPVDSNTAGAHFSHLGAVITSAVKVSS